jgi:hypothetical protein
MVLLELLFPLIVPVSRWIAISERISSDVLSYQHRRGTPCRLRPGASGSIILPVLAGALLQARDVRASRVFVWDSGGSVADEPVNVFD